MATTGVSAKGSFRIGSKKNRKVLPIDAQSLPDLKTLLDKVEKFEDSGEFVRVDIFVPDSIADHKKELDKKLQNAISQTKDVKLSTFQQQMIQQGLDERRMKKNLALATKSFKELMDQCTAANDAIKERKSKQLLEHKVLAAKELKTLSELVDPYEQALKDDWLKSKIRGNRHAEDGIKAFQKMYTVGKSELKKIANVKID